MDRKRPIVVAITGASGAAYACRLLDCLIRLDRDVHLVVSPYGRQLLADELDISLPTASALIGRDTDRLTVHSYNDLSSPLASGSFLSAGMVVCPCSSNTLGAVAAGIGSNLIARAAHVTLKESRRLILVTREMPMSLIELRNAQRVAEAGGIICPASPGFYLRPTRIAELLDFVVGKVLDLLEIEHDLNTRWDPSARGGDAKSSD